MRRAQDRAVPVPRAQFFASIKLKNDDESEDSDDESEDSDDDGEFDPFAEELDSN